MKNKLSHTILCLRLGVCRLRKGMVINMIRMAPEHIIKYCHQDLDDSTYNYLNQKFQDSITLVHKIKCTCGCEKFKVYVDEHPSIFVECNSCGNYITVYDLKYYTCAVKLDKEFECKIYDNGDIFSVYAIYSYYDDYMNDSEFDQNDITWAYVYITKGEKIIEILDDETA